MQARVRFVRSARNPLRRSRVSSARNAGESTICPVRAGECAICRLRAQPSAEIVRVECAKCRRECDVPAARATLCGDRACRVRETQARARWGVCARNPLRRSCVSSARSAGESAIYRLYTRATLCGDRARRARAMLASVRLSLCARNPLRRYISMDAFPLTGHCFETLLAWLPQHFLCSFQLGFFSEIPCSRALGFFILPLPAAHTLMTMSWAVTAWPPVGVWEACALLRSSPLTGHCLETLLAWLPPHFLCSFQLGFFSEIPYTRARCFSPYQQLTCSRR